MYDLRFAEDALNICDKYNNYNQYVVLLQQCVEKLLKGFVGSYLNFDGSYDKDLRSHNLQKLGSIIKEHTENKFTIKGSELKYIGSFYWDARYPGDNYTIVNDKDIALECREITYNVINQLKSLEPSREPEQVKKKTSEFLKKL